MNENEKLNFKIGNVLFENPILNASGCWSASKEQIDELVNSKLGGIVTKTCTIFSKNGNEEPNYYYDKDNDIHFNCKGLPNNGYEYYKKINNNILKKPIILSIAYTELNELLMILNDYNKHASKDVVVEINMSCPNVETRIPGYHIEDIERVLSSIKNMNYSNLHIGFKLPPYFEIDFMKMLASLFNAYQSIIYFIVSSNSIPNSLPIKNNMDPILSNVYGGISGKFNKYIALSNVKTFHSLLCKTIVIVGCGGIETCEDVMEYLHFGASFVQLASCFYNEKTNSLDINKINDIVEKYVCNS